MAREISNSDDIIDSRDVIDRIRELKDEREALQEALEDIDAGDTSQDEARSAAAMELAAWDQDNLEELEALRAVQEEAEGYCEDWRYGAQLIRDSYFESYAREFAEDIGAIKSDLGWPYGCIDWKRAARELRMDYTAVEFGDVTYWVR